MKTSNFSVKSSFGKALRLLALTLMLFAFQNCSSGFDPATQPAIVGGDQDETLGGRDPFSVEEPAANNHHAQVFSEDEFLLYKATSGEFNFHAKLEYTRDRRKTVFTYPANPNEKVSGLLAGPARLSFLKLSATTENQIVIYFSAISDSPRDSKTFFLVIDRKSRTTPFKVVAIPTQVSNSECTLGDIVWHGGNWFMASNCQSKWLVYKVSADFLNVELSDLMELPTSTYGPNPKLVSLPDGCVVALGSPGYTISFDPNYYSTRVRFSCDDGGTWSDAYSEKIEGRYLYFAQDYFVDQNEVVAIRIEGTRGDAAWSRPSLLRFDSRGQKLSTIEFPDYRDLRIKKIAQCDYLGIADKVSPSAVVVIRSKDCGLTWSEIKELPDVAFFNTPAGSKEWLVSFDVFRRSDGVYMSISKRLNNFVHEAFKVSD